MSAAFITVILFSFAAISGRRLGHYLGGTQANFVRLMLVAMLLGAVLCVFNFKFNLAAFAYLFISGCVGFGIGDLSMFQAYPRIGTRRTIVLIQCLAAPFAALAEWAWLGHAPTLIQTGFGVLVLAGVGIALLPGKAEAQPTHGLIAGVCFGVISAVCQGGGAVLSRKAYAVAAEAGQALDGVRDGLGVALQRVLGGMVISGVFFGYLKIAHKPFAAQKANWTAAWPWLIASALSGPALGVTCYQWALMTEPTNVVLPIVAITPLAVIPLAHWLEGDRITARAVIGGVIAVAGVIGLARVSTH